MLWLTILAVISMAVGVVSGITGLRSMRSQEPEQAEIRWKQAPLSPWRYETLTISVIALHSLGLIGLTALLLRSLAHSDVFTFSTRLDLSFLRFAFALFALFFTTYVTGVMIAYHFAQQWIRPVSYGIRAEGLLYGGTLIGWQSYSHYEQGPEDDLISLYSSYSPPIRTWVIQPPAESFAAVLGIIQRNLPSTPPMDDSISWLRSPLALIVGMTALVVIALLPALWGWFLEQSWVWMYGLVAFFAVQYFGIQLITLFDGRGQRPAAKSVEA